MLVTESRFKSQPTVFTWLAHPSPSVLKEIGITAIHKPCLKTKQNSRKLREGSSSSRLVRPKKVSKSREQRAEPLSGVSKGGASLLGSKRTQWTMDWMWEHPFLGTATKPVLTAVNKMVKRKEPEYKKTRGCGGP